MLLKHTIAKNQKTANIASGYIWAGNGIFRSAQRTEFKTIVRHSAVNTPGLPGLKETFDLLVPPVPENKVQNILAQVKKHPNLEQLFYLYWREDHWDIVCPEQECTPASCFSLETHPEPAAIEIHSHGAMKAFFSSTDNAEETGFRVSSVIGRNDQGDLEIVTRVCVHGGFLPISSDLIYQNINRYCYHVIPF